MCNNNGHCRKFDAGHDVPELSRHARREASDARPRQHAAPRAVGAASATTSRPSGRARGARPVRELQGMQARMSDRRRHGADEDRVPAPVAEGARPRRARSASIADLPRWAPWASRFAWLVNLRNRWHWLARHRRAQARLLGAAQAAGVALRRVRRVRRSGDDAWTRRTSCCSSIRSRATSSPRTRAPRCACSARRAIASRWRRRRRARRCAAAARISPRGSSTRRATHARRLIAALAPAVARAIPIVGLEPSCLLSLRDEYLVMGLGDDAARLAAQGMLIEEFLAREHDEGKLRLPLRALPQSRALLHGHCHQKAFDVMGPTVAVLRLVPNLAVDVVESSCCGMAGSFGYEAAHVDVSLAMAELVAAACGTQGGRRYADRRRRHELPAPDRRRRRAARGDPRHSRARARARSGQRAESDAVRAVALRDVAAARSSPPGSAASAV